MNIKKALYLTAMFFVGLILFTVFMTTPVLGALSWIILLGSQMIFFFVFLSLTDS